MEKSLHPESPIVPMKTITYAIPGPRVLPDLDC